MGFLLGAAIFGAFACVAAVLLVGIVLKTVFWLVFLPLRLLAGLLFFPVWVARTLVKAIGLLILTPLLAVIGAILAGGLLIAGLLALVVPMLPLILIALLIWMIVGTFVRRTVPAA
jgi:hypothetical protein